jgi:hypothetical protein
MVNGQTVELTPLFHWWRGHEGERPLKAWVHVTGHIGETSAWGWILTAHVEHLGEKGESADKELKIILRSPPTGEKEEFDRLKGQLNGLQSQRSQLSSQAATAASSSKEYSHQRHGHGVSAAYHQQETADKDQIKRIDEQIKEINQKLAVFPEHDKFAVDCFALHTGQMVNGLPVYDHGMGVK